MHAQAFTNCDRTTPPAPCALPGPLYKEARLLSPHHWSPQTTPNQHFHSRRVSVYKSWQMVEKSESYTQNISVETVSAVSNFQRYRDTIPGNGDKPRPRTWTPRSFPFPAFEFSSFPRRNGNSSKNSVFHAIIIIINWPIL